MHITFTANSRRVGILAARTLVALSVAYGAVLAIGLLRLPSPDVPIGGALLAIMELLILAIAPTAVVLMVVLHAWAEPADKLFSLLALTFMGMLATVSCAVHFVVLSVSLQPAMIAMPSAALLFSFTWPSVVYALDILAWDVFFPMSAACAAFVFRSHIAGKRIQQLLMLSALMAVAGLSGVVANDMRLRNIGIVGYAVVFPVAVWLMGRLFARTAPHVA